MNCGQCYKCARTLLFAEVNGNLEDFAETFDLAAFKRRRTHSLLRLLHSTLTRNELADDQDTLAYLCEQGHGLPLWLRTIRPFIRHSTLHSTSSVD